MSNILEDIRDFNPVESLFGHWTTLNSSNVKAFRYDASKHVLQIQFVGGRVYSYKDVPQNVVDGLASAESPGSYVHSAIKDSYSLE